MARRNKYVPMIKLLSCCECSGGGGGTVTPVPAGFSDKKQLVAVMPFFGYGNGFNDNAFPTDFGNVGTKLLYKFTDPTWCYSKVDWQITNVPYTDQQGNPQTGGKFSGTWQTYSYYDATNFMPAYDQVGSPVQAGWQKGQGFWWGGAWGFTAYHPGNVTSSSISTTSAVFNFESGATLTMNLSGRLNRTDLDAVLNSFGFFDDSDLITTSEGDKGYFSYLKINFSTGKNDINGKPIADGNFKLLCLLPIKGGTYLTARVGDVSCEAAKYAASRFVYLATPGSLIGNVCRQPLSPSANGDYLIHRMEAFVNTINVNGGSQQMWFEQNSLSLGIQPPVKQPLLVFIDEVVLRPSDVPGEGMLTLQADTPPSGGGGGPSP